MKHKLKLLVSICTWVAIYLCVASLGFILGMVYQQLLMTQEIGTIMSYADIHVDFNGTKFAEELNRTFIPAWKQAFNQTIVEQVVGTK